MWPGEAESDWLVNPQRRRFTMAALNRKHCQTQYITMQAHHCCSLQADSSSALAVHQSTAAAEPHHRLSPVEAAPTNVAGTVSKLARTPGCRSL